MILYIRLLELYLGYTLLYSDTLDQLPSNNDPKKKKKIWDGVLCHKSHGGIILPIVRDFSKNKTRKDIYIYIYILCCLEVTI